MSLFIRRETDVWGSLRFLRAVLTEATERLAQRSTEAADLRLLCDELEVEAAAARSSLGMSSVSMSRRRWGCFGRPWRSFPGTFPGSSR